VIKGASGLQYGGDAVGGLVVIEPISVKGHAVWQNHSEFGVQWQRRFLLVLYKGNDNGWSWNALGTSQVFRRQRSTGLCIVH
jgi:iron complex outermembrane receptor protein